MASSLIGDPRPGWKGTNAVRVKFFLPKKNLTEPLYSQIQPHKKLKVESCELKVRAENLAEKETKQKIEG